MASSPASIKTAPKKELDISEEADKAIRPWVMIGLPASFAGLFLIPMSVIFLGIGFPKNHMISGQFSPISIISYFVWMIPFYYVISNVYRIRMEFARKYVAEKKWVEAEAALTSFDTFGQKFFDRSGECHYLLAFALDGLGKRVAAEKAREFVRKHRPKSEYAKLVGAPKEIIVVTASSLKKRDASEVDDDSDMNAATGSLKKSKRRRF